MRTLNAAHRRIGSAQTDAVFFTNTGDSMKRQALAALALLILCVVVPWALAAETQTLEGEFVWERDDEDIAGPLKAVFEPTGEAAWNVAFYFTFEDRSHVYTGTAEGSLTEGELKGEVTSDSDEPQSYRFSGSFAADGSFEGTHFYLGDGEARQTGTIRFGS
jgi:hypothetical protein